MSVFTAEAPATTAETITKESLKRLTLEQAQALFQLIEAFRPGWADWKTVAAKLQEVSLTTGIEGHDIVTYVITSAATRADLTFEDLDFNQIHA